MDLSPLQRRTLLAGLGGAALSPMAARRGRAVGPDLVVTAYGGVWEEQFRHCYVEPFMKQTGAHVDVVLGTPSQWLNQVAANPANPPVHVIINTIDGAADGRHRKLVDAFSDERLPNLKQVPQQFQDVGAGYGSVLNYGAMGLAYDANSVKTPPQSWDEFIEGTIAGKWKAAVPDINYVSTNYTLVWMFNQFYGGTLDNIEPALSRIKAMRKSGNMVFWTDVNQFLNMLQAGDIDIGMYWDGRTFAFQDSGHPNIRYLNPKPGVVISPTVIQKVRNAPDLAWQFIDWALSAEPEACRGNALNYGMANSTVVYTPKVEPRVVKLPDILWPPSEQLPAHNAAWVEQWNREIGG